MRTISTFAVALGCATLAIPFVNAAPDPSRPPSSGVWQAGSSDGAGLPGLPGGQAGASGSLEDDVLPSDLEARDIADPLRRYCVEVLSETETESVAGVPMSDFRPGDCFGLFVTVAQAGQPGRGGDGGGFPGLPGGRGGDSGGPWGGRGGDGGSLPGLPGGRGGQSGAATGSLTPGAPFVRYCVRLLLSRGRATSNQYTPLDCAGYLMALDGVAGPPGWAPAYPNKGVARSRGHGSDGPSIAGGIGGRGGRAGSGPGGGSGGAGGAGVGGGIGGRGGAGGPAY